MKEAKEVQEVLRRSWPKEVPTKLVYRLGEKPLHEYLRQNAIDFPEKTAYNFYGKEISWQDLNEMTLKFAQFLKNQGMKKGSHIALYMQNSPQYLIGHYAIQMIGGVVVPLNPMYKSAELEYMVKEAEIEAIISGQELYEQIDTDWSTLRLVVTTNYADLLPTDCTLPIPTELTLVKEKHSNTFDMLAEIIACEPLTERVSINIWQDVGLMVFTSGTTGRPKAAMLTYGNALFKTAAATHGYLVNEEDMTLATAPFCHIAGMVMGVNLPIYSASTCTILTRFEPEAAIKAIELYKVSKLYTVAPMNVAILHYPEIEKRDLTSLKLNFATSFGMNVDEKLANAWQELTKGCLLCEASYGLSETHTCDTFMPIDHIKYGSCGIATFDTEFRVIDLLTGEDLPPGEQGEILVKNPGVFKAYYKRPDATAETLKEGWVYTGDIGVIDEEGYLYFKGRTKEMIKSSGFSVFPEDVEALMSEHEAVGQIAVIGVPDETRGENVKAFIVLKEKYKDSISPEEMIIWAKEKMAAYKYPREVVFMDALPATSSGKILRRLLKES